MFASLQAFNRRVIAVCSFLFLALYGLVRWLLTALFGQWQPPFWLHKLWKGLCAGGRWLRARPKQTAATLAGLALLGAIGAYAWHWYKNLPVPHMVVYSVHAPELTGYKSSPISVDTLRINFSESAAPLEAIEQKVERGIAIEPELQGNWHWASDRRLVFTPANDWPIDQTYRVIMDKEQLLADGVLLKQYDFEFHSKAFSADLARRELYQDPVVPSLKKLVATFTFSHPVDEDSFHQRVSVSLDSGLEYRDKDSSTAPEISFSKDKLTAYVHSAPLATPLESSTVSLAVDKGVKARNGGNATTQQLHTSATVPGRYRLTFSGSTIQFVDNDRGEPEPVLMFNSSSAVDDDAIKSKVQAWLLPQYNASGGEYWSEESVDEKLLASAERLPLTHIPSVAPLNSLHAFKFKAQPNRYIYVRVAAQVEAVGGYLAKDPTRSVLQMPQYPRALSFLSDGALLSLNGEQQLGLLARGVSGAHVEIARLLPNQLHHLVDQNHGSFARPAFSNGYFDRLVERMSVELPIDATDPSKTHYDHVDLAPYLNADGGRRGIFVVKLSTPEARNDDTFDYYSSDNSPTDLRFIVVTDLGIIAKRSSDGSHDLFVQSLSEGGAVAGAEVQIIGRNGLPVASGYTDANGQAHFAKLDELRREKTPLMYVVSLGKDQSFLPVARNQHRLDLSRFDIGGQYEGGVPDRLSAYLFSDRGLYRPGETAHLGMIVRAANWAGQLSGLPVELDVRDPRGQSVLRQQLKLSSSGFEALDFHSSEAAPAGTYTASLNLIDDQGRRSELGSSEFKVRDFEPDRMKVSTTLAKTPIKGWIAPSEVEAKVKALHLFGAPAAGRRVTAEMILAPAYAAFAGYEDYRFRLNNSLNDSSSEELAESITDDNGEAILDLRLQRFAASTYSLNLLARVFEAEGGRNVAAQSALMVSSSPWLVGVKSVDSLNYVSKGAKREVEWLALGPDLKPLAVEGLTTELVEQRYVSVLVKQSNGTYKYESRVKNITLESQPLSIAAAGSKQRLNTSEPGDFTLTLKAADGTPLNQVGYSVAGSGNASRSLERNAELQLRLDRDSYAQGEEVEISIRAPYTGAGLITIERDKVYSHQWFKADSTSSVQRIRLPSELEGNAYINVQFVRDGASPEVYMSPLSYGVAPLRIELDARRIPLQIEAPTHIQPGQTLQMNLRSDRPGRAVIYAVDEGILQVARYQAPDPLAQFFRKRALEVQTSQILDLLLPEFSLLLQAAAPGGDGEELLGAHLNPFKRKRKPPVAYWSGLVDLAEGDNSFSYPVPDYFNGKLHLFAVAVDDQRIGVAEGASEVRGPLVITPNVPAFVAPGDVFTVSAGVFSNLEQDAKVQFSLETSAGLQVEAISQRELELAPRKEGVVEISLKALETLGSADMKFVATLADGRRVQIEETTSVRPLVERRVALSIGRFSSASGEVPITRELFPQLRDVRFSAGGSPLVWADGLQSYLAEYGYSCTEQLVSKAMPALVWGSSAQGVEAAALPAFSNAVRILRQRQNLSGGFGLWTATPDAAPFASLYASDFLIEAKERNYPVPGDLLVRANGYLSEVANGPSNGLSELRNRAYASYLLTRQGVVTSGALADIRERYETYYSKNWQQDIGAAYLAASYKLLKQDKQADKLFAAQQWRSLEKTWSSDGLYYDPLVHDAEHLRLLSKHFPGKLDKVPLTLLDSLGKRLSEQRYNSLSAALLLRALDSYGERAEAGLELKVSAWLGKQQGEQALTLSGKPPIVEVPMATKMLLLRKSGDAPAFFMLSETGYDRAAPNKVISDGLEIFHDYLDLNGQALKQVRVGDEFLVRLRMRAKQHDQVQQVAVVDLLPGGVEPVYNQPAPVSASEDEEEGYSEEYGGQPAWQPPIGESAMSDWAPDFADVRDDRVVLYGTLYRNASTFTYRVRATNAGTFGTPPAYAEGMYDTSMQARGKSGTLQIVKP
ncbi:MAG TPA: alpha-2-macroglobulin [Pseudomonas sp.]|uniref:alpha-2-macroglobulin n=1 Tax=Pseudomonas sp. TaxID=306 RepID=UPI002CE3F16F|nr:alpha-2-macroglobulin [Pseudomonas sp.]HSX90850.1 alpha-2-macroglobulin [Pseudomonas sp.]